MRCWRSRRENSEPSCQASRRGHAQDYVEHVGAVGVQGRWAGPFHLPPTSRRADPGQSGREMRAWLRACARKHPCHGFRRAWAALRYDESREVKKKKIHRLWREEGLQVKVISPRKRLGCPRVGPPGGTPP
jgi:hypothetical protein